MDDSRSNNPRRGPGYELFKLFIMPLLARRPKEVFPEDFLAQVFSVNTRIISKYRAAQGFNMPGARCENEVLPARTKKHYRFIKRGTKMLCRVDDTTGEIHVDTGKSIFYLNEQDWKSIRSKLILYKNEEELL